MPFCLGSIGAVMAKVTPVPMSDSEKRYEAARIELAALYGSMRQSHLNAIINATVSTKHLNKDMARDEKHSEEAWAVARRAIGPLVAALDSEIFSRVMSRNTSKLERVDGLLEMCRRLRDLRTAAVSGTEEARSALRALAQRCFNKVDLAKTQLPGTGFAQLASLCFLVIHLCAHGEFKQVDACISEVFKRMFSKTKCAGGESSDPVMLLSKYALSGSSPSASAPHHTEAAPAAEGTGSRVKLRVSPFPTKAFVVVGKRSASAPDPLPSIKLVKIDSERKQERSVSAPEPAKATTVAGAPATPPETPVKTIPAAASGPGTGSKKASADAQTPELAKARKRAASAPETPVGNTPVAPSGPSTRSKKARTDEQAPEVKAPGSQKRSASDPSPAVFKETPRKSAEAKDDSVPVSPDSAAAPAQAAQPPAAAPAPAPTQPAFPPRIRIVLKRPPTA